jgi:hypothetical protein
MWISFEFTWIQILKQPTSPPVTVVLEATRQQPSSRLFWHQPRPHGRRPRPPWPGHYQLGHRPLVGAGPPHRFGHCVAALTTWPPSSAPHHASIKGPPRHHRHFFSPLFLPLRATGTSSPHPPPYVLFSVGRWGVTAVANLKPPPPLHPTHSDPPLRSSLSAIVDPSSLPVAPHAVGSRRHCQSWDVVALPPPSRLAINAPCWWAPASKNLPDTIHVPQQCCSYHRRYSSSSDSSIAAAHALPMVTTLARLHMPPRWPAQAGRPKWPLGQANSAGPQPEKPAQDCAWIFHFPIFF